MSLRFRVAQVGVVVGLVLVALLTLVSPASAHHPIVSGEVACSADGQTVVVSWHVQNSETVTGTNRTMTLLSAVVSQGTLVGISAGMTAPPQPLAGSTINGSTTLPSTTSGSVTLTVHGRWPSPGPQDVTGSATVQLPGACAQPKGSLKVTKSVDWNGVTPDQSKTFEICITGPSYPNGNCQTVGFNGGTLTWNDLTPGDYTATETSPGSSWSVSGSPTGVITVPALGGLATNKPTITNTRKHGSLKVTKSVDWNGVTPDQSKTFEICITGPSYPNGNCKTVDFDGGMLTWSDLIPGAYTATETNPGASWTVAGSPTGVITVPSDGGLAENKPTITNTRKHGSLQVTKSVDWNGVTPDQSKTFEICITGPSYPNGNCQTAGFNGGTLTWSNLVPGHYTATETNPGSSWTVVGSPTDVITVPSNGDPADIVPVISNTRKHGSLKVTKSVDWNGVTPDQSKTFEICITGPSYPNGNCKTADFDGGTLTWSDLIPGAYTATETNPGASWTVAGSPTGVITVPSDGGLAENKPTITNTRKHGSLQVTKSVDWNGVTPDHAKTFEICITGPSYPNGNCKTIDFDGGTLTWSDLIPGAYTATETNPGASWKVVGSPTATITVPTDGSTAQLVPVISNTRKHGSLSVTKQVEWNGVTPDDNQTFEVCITGPSYPVDANCKSVGKAGGTLTWSDLIPGAYTATETSPGANWSVAGSPTGTITVPSDGGAASLVPVITNTRRLGSLQVTKSVDWNGVTPDQDQTFSICISGPSFPDQPDCKTIGADGGTLTWSHLVPGAYTASESDPGASWNVGGSPTA
ncbi:MAG TPA: hypothetical protein VHD87_05435, partial [Acidimicrobiales bacterium]|nr:hypothetical protein [Acidimicrobiales bacterium]